MAAHFGPGTGPANALYTLPVGLVRAMVVMETVVLEYSCRELHFSNDWVVVFRTVMSFPMYSKFGVVRITSLSCVTISDSLSSLFGVG